MNLPYRKHLRHPWWDYHNFACYHLVLCTAGHQHLFGEIARETMILSLGQILEETIRNLETYRQIEVRSYVIMPNHLHLLIALLAPENPSDPDRKISIPDLVRQIKSITAARHIRDVKSGLAEPFTGKIWQRSYYDRIVRNEREYSAIWTYIDSNPEKWAFDRENR